MALVDKINAEYFDWMCNLVCGERYSGQISYNQLLSFLHSVEFTYVIPRDENRACDGIYLRYRFGIACGYEDLYEQIDGPCSVLEMMVSLALNCEETMDDTSYGDRTGQWFWGMIRNLGLMAMIDGRFDLQYAEEVIFRFLNREYEPDGTGGLFTVKNCKYDLRKIEIWYQLCWYLDSIV